MEFWTHARSRPSKWARTWPPGSGPDKSSPFGDRWARETGDQPDLYHRQRIHLRPLFHFDMYRLICW